MISITPRTDLGGFLGPSVDGFVVDFVGTRIRRDFNALSAQPSGIIEISSLRVDEEVFEWMDIIESVETARGISSDAYVFAELGAGFGRWSVRAHHFARRAGFGHPRLILVEAEPQHLEWLKLHLAANGVSSDCAAIHPSALSSTVGKTLFYVAMPQGTSQNSPAEWYGQSIVKDYERPMRRRRPALSLLSRMFERAKGTASSEYTDAVLLASGWEAVPASTKRLRDCVPDGVIIDLADFDVQGAELEAISESIDVCDNAIRMLHVGTHSMEIEAGLREILGAHGWKCVRDYSLHGARETELGPVSFLDGVQTWINPRLRPVKYSLEVDVD